MSGLFLERNGCIRMGDGWQLRILYPSCALPPSLSGSGLFHQRWACVKDPAGCSEVFV